MQSLLKKFWQCESVMSELKNSYSQKAVHRYVENFELVLRDEYEYVAGCMKDQSIQCVISVGSGIIPFTYIFYQRLLENMRIKGIEKKYHFAKLSRYICDKYFNFIPKIVVCNASGFTLWDNSLIIVSLLVANKLDVIDAIMRSTNNVIIIRNPLSDKRWRYDYLKPISTNMHVIRHRDRCFESCIIANSANTIAGN